MIKKNISKLYRPSSFWEDAATKIKNEIDENGIENFRRLKTPLSFFVPTYGMPGNSFDNKIEKKIIEIIQKEGNKKQELYIKNWISGETQARSDYRVFSASLKNDLQFNLKNFSESSYGNPIEHFTFDNKKYSRSSLNYLLGLSFLNKYLDNTDKIDTVMEIGGGFGTLGEILSFSKNKKYIDLDIYPSSQIALSYLKNIYGNSINESLDITKSNISSLSKCTVLNSWNIENLEGQIDLFVNFISFQEMEPEIVINYVKHVIRFNPKWILLRNMKEGKQKQSLVNKIGVKTPVESSDYISYLKKFNYKLIGRNIIEYGYKTVDDFNSEILVFKR